jgi:hypothetical protein
MGMWKFFVVVACSLPLAGCARYQWVANDPAAAANIDQAKLACEYESKVATPDTSSARGLGNAVADGIQQGTRMAELQTMCMQLKGYHKEQVAAQ